MACRSCIGCKTVCEKTDLLRLVVSDGRLVVDELACQPGRGAYVHRRLACVRKSMEAKLLAHRFRCKGTPIDVSALGELLASLAQQG